MGSPTRPLRWIGSIMILLSVTSSGAAAEPPQSAISSMLEPGPEAKALAARAGDWTVTITMHPSPDAAPLVTTNLKAERTMIGGFLQEVISPADSSTPPFKRVSYLHYSRVEGRWQYVSMDTRFPAGIMPAYSNDAGSPDHIILEFLPIAFAGWGSAVDGWMLRSSYEVTGIGSDHEIARQYWSRANGTGRRWLGVEYDYRRLAGRAR